MIAAQIQHKCEIAHSNLASILEHLAQVNQLNDAKGHSFRIDKTIYTNDTNGTTYHNQYQRLSVIQTRPAIKEHWVSIIFIFRSPTCQSALAFPQQQGAQNPWLASWEAQKNE